MNLTTLVYVSSAVKILTDLELAEILKVSVRNNIKNNITGMLVYKGGNFMQVLEGDEVAVSQTHAKIVSDPRHRGLITLVNRPLTERVFDTWAMGFKNADKLSIAENKHCSDFLDSSLTDERYVKNPSQAVRLLLTFKNSIR